MPRLGSPGAAIFDNSDKLAVEFIGVFIGYAQRRYIICGDAVEGLVILTPHLPKTPLYRLIKIIFHRFQVRICEKKKNWVKLMGGCGSQTQSLCFASINFENKKYSFAFVFSVIWSLVLSLESSQHNYFC